MNSDLNYAGLAIRLSAGILDFLMMLGIAVLVFSLFEDGFSFDLLQSFGLNVGYLLYLIILPLVWNGYVIGKRIVHIKVKKMNDQKLTFLDMFIRECVGKFILAYVTLGLTTIISGFMVFLRKDKRAIHDLLAGTYVYLE